MGFHYFKLFRGELPGFMQDSIGNSHFTDIMERTDPGKFFGKRERNTKLWMFTCQIPC